MKISLKLTAACMVVLLTAATSWSQTTEQAESEEQAKPSKTEGMKKIASGNYEPNYVDHEMLEVNIEMAVNQAMEVVRTTLHNLEIHIPAFNIEPVSLDAIDIDLKDIDIDIDPVDIDLSEADIAPDVIVDYDDKGKSDGKDKEAKGLKELN